MTTKKSARFLASPRGFIRAAWAAAFSLLDGGWRGFKAHALFLRGTKIPQAVINQLISKGKTRNFPVKLVGRHQAPPLKGSPVISGPKIQRSGAEY